MTNETEAVRAEQHDLDMMTMQAQMVWDYVMKVSPWSSSNDMLWADEIIIGISFLVENNKDHAALIDRLTGEVERLRDELQKAKWESERHWALASGYQREMKAAERRVAELEADSLRYKWIERTYNMAKMGDASNILYAFGLPPDDPMANLSVLIDAAVNSLTQPEADHG